jgi:hypothetical protein
MQLETEAQMARLSGQADVAWAALEAAVGVELTAPAAVQSPVNPGKE